MLVHERVVVGDVFLSRQAVVPGEAPVNDPFGHEPGAGGVPDLSSLTLSRLLVLL